MDNIPIKKIAIPKINQSCQMCKKKEKEVLIMPCRHHTICDECSINLKSCPCCGAEIDSIIKLFKS